jgi:hypothetical protein
MKTHKYPVEAEIVWMRVAFEGKDKDKVRTLTIGPYKRVKLLQYPIRLCSNCAHRQRGVWPQGHVASFYPALCLSCYQEKMCTEMRDYKFPLESQDGVRFRALKTKSLRLHKRFVCAWAKRKPDTWPTRFRGGLVRFKAIKEARSTKSREKKPPKA